MDKLTIRDIDVNDKKVLLRCDFNVPLNEEGEITDKTRIIAALPTINYLLERNAKIILCSHLGRPKGEVKPEFSLKPVAKELSNLIGKEVIMAEDVVGTDAKTKAQNLQNGEILLLENLLTDSPSVIKNIFFSNFFFPYLAINSSIAKSIARKISPLSSSSSASIEFN